MCRVDKDEEQGEKYPEKYMCDWGLVELVTEGSWTSTLNRKTRTKEDLRSSFVCNEMNLH